MKLKFASAAAAVALAAAAAVAVPTAAQAAPYGSTDSCSISPVTISPGSIFIFICPGGTWTPGVTITFTISGEGAGGTSKALLNTAVETFTATDTAAADGSSSTSFRASSTASGAFTVQATSTDRTIATESVFISPNGVPADGGTGTTGTTGSGTSGTGLAATGVDSQELLGLWVGGGALALVGGGLVAATAIRRNRKLASHN